MQNCIQSVCVKYVKHYFAGYSPALVFTVISCTKYGCVLYYYRIQVLSTRIKAAVNRLNIAIVIDSNIDV